MTHTNVLDRDMKITTKISQDIFRELDEYATNRLLHLIKEGCDSLAMEVPERIYVRVEIPVFQIYADGDYYRGACYKAHVHEQVSKEYMKEYPISSFDIQPSSTSQEKYEEY